MSAIRRAAAISVAQAATAQEAMLPARVQEALGEFVGAAKEGLLALSVGVRLGVLAELMDEEVDEVVGSKGRHRLIGYRDLAKVDQQSAGGAAIGARHDKRRSWFVRRFRIRRCLPMKRPCAPAFAQTRPSTKPVRCSRSPSRRTRRPECASDDEGR